MIAKGQPPRRLLPVASFTAAYLALALVGAVTGGNAEFIFYIVVMLVLVVAVWGVDRVVRLSSGALWGLSIWGLAHMIGGLVPAPAGWPTAVPEGAVIYNVWLIPGRIKYDHLVHAWGFGITTWVCWQGLGAAMRRRGAVSTPTGGVLVLVAAAGLGFGALNEIVEFAATLLVPETNVGGYRNTGWDLVANLVGATVAVTLIRLGAGRNSSG
ncbi:MAG: DUF2238 domain-containing protein [Gemmatimonadota bacterium]|nr:DUF2238 domain-containing protein [Gemmatimonadota bacterium]